MKRTSCGCQPSSPGQQCEMTPMQATDEIVRTVVSQVLARMRNGSVPASPSRNGHGTTQRGVFNDVTAAVAAAVEAQRQFERRGLEDRRKAIACIRKICSEQAETLGAKSWKRHRLASSSTRSRSSRSSRTASPVWSFCAPTPSAERMAFRFRNMPRSESLESSRR